MNLKVLFPIVLLLCFLSPAISQEVSIKKLRKHLVWLADDARQGRGTGTDAEREAADYLAKQFQKLGLVGKGDNGTFFHNFGFQKSLDPHGTSSSDGAQVYSRNVAAFLDNGAAYTIVIGAHYDHLGLGHDKNSLDPNAPGKIHNGADDNASGTSGVLELARYFAKNGLREKHNFLFLCFSGEELGLIGSKKFADYPTVDLSKVSFMVNMDMIGRMNDEKRLMVGGIGTAPDFVPALEAANTGGLIIKRDSAGVGPSDHTSFYLKNIPVVFVFTGQHSDYHKPSDDADKINFDGMVSVLQFVIRLVERLDQVEKLTFQETKSNPDNTPRFTVTLGIMPDYTFEGLGVKVDGVTSGKPASKAGILKGDEIIGLGEMPVMNIQDYMKALSKFKKGDTTVVKIKRGEAEKTFDINF